MLTDHGGCRWERSLSAELAFTAFVALPLHSYWARAGLSAIHGYLSNDSDGYEAAAPRLMVRRRQVLRRVE